MEEQAKTTEGTRVKRRPAFVLKKPNGKGTGAMMMMALVPGDWDEEGHMALAIAPQKTIGERRGGRSVPPAFDHEHGRSVKLRFGDLARVLEVLHGIKPELDDG